MGTNGVRASFVITTTGALWHLFRRQPESGSLERVEHDGLPAYGVDKVLAVIAGLGYREFAVSIVR